MTSNQLQYWRNKEEQRSNQAREAETRRSNLANESETHRSNVSRESETHRSNLINESQRAGELAETIRANQARENETHRSNVAKETETYRSNVQNEQIKWFQNFETKRSNLAREYETHRSNVANEAINQDRNDLTREHYERQDYETNRHNLASEGLEAERNSISRENIALGYDTLAQRERESQRNLQGTLYSADSRYAASVYAADTNAAVGWGNLAELNRHNLANEFNQQLGISSTFRTQSQANANQQQQNEYAMERWRGEQNVRDSQAALNNARAQSEDELRNARKHNLYSSTTQNYTKAFANVYSSIAGRKK